MEGTKERDASGNVRLRDVGIFLRERIRAHFRELGVPVGLKYIDPSYTIRSGVTNAHDAAFCLTLGHNAVHAGMAGRTNVVVGYWKREFTHVPIPMAVGQRKRIDPEGVLWSSVLATTGQPKEMGGTGP
jgi:6-phosphofructokinase 1